MVQTKPKAGAQNQLRLAKIPTYSNPKIKGVVYWRPGLLAVQWEPESVT